MDFQMCGWDGGELEMAVSKWWNIGWQSDRLGGSVAETLAWA
jgi:hypothetical protein